MDEKKLKALAAELAKGLKTEADLNAFSRMLTKLTVKQTNAELTDHLGHEKRAPSRLQYPVLAIRQKLCLRDDGEIELSTPRDRETPLNLC
ncbi:hypothetical protein [Erwinia pyrifoliae]|uniref:hypothetical protein n=1 Tax=Erwinia pyrifoliae TaxID=79967 RepID=UPI0034D968CB